MAGASRSAAGSSLEEAASRQSRAVDPLADYGLGLPSAGLALVRGQAALSLGRRA